MGAGKRFGRQYRANLDEYRRQRPWRLLRLILAFGMALALGGLLEIGKNFPPPVFYGLVALVVAGAVVFAVFRIARLVTRAGHEADHIFHGPDEDSPGNETRGQSAQDPDIVEVAPVRSKSRRDLPAGKQPPSGSQWVVGCLIALVGVSCLGVPALGGLGWWYFSSRPKTVPTGPVFPVPVPFRPLEPR